MSSSPINKKQTLHSNKNIGFHTDNGLKKEHISEVNKLKNIFFTTDNNHIKDNKPEKEAICANNNSSHTNTESKNNNNNNNSNNNSDNIQDTMTRNPLPNPSKTKPSDQSTAE